MNIQNVPTGGAVEKMVRDRGGLFHVSDRVLGLGSVAAKKYEGESLRLRGSRLSAGDIRRRD